MERNCNSKYLEIQKKKDLPNNKMSIRNRFTYYPLYDVDKNSYIRRYRMWMKYREKCIDNNRPYVNVKQYGKILYKMSDQIKNILMTDPDGVLFSTFKLKIVIERNVPTITVISRIKQKKGIFFANNWKLLTNRLFKDLIIKNYKKNKLVNFQKNKRPSKTKQILDLFNDF